MSRAHKPVFIGFGSNQGKRLNHIAKAIRLIKKMPGSRLARVSSLYRTQAVGGPKQRDHFNGVLKLQTTLNVDSLLLHLQTIENDLGRVRKERWGPRPIDLDILTFGRARIHRPGLEIPHPRYDRRRFVLIPFCELSPRLLHPRLRLTNAALLRRLTPGGQRVTMAAQWKKQRFYPFKKRNGRKSPSSR